MDFDTKRERDASVCETSREKEQVLILVLSIPLCRCGTDQWPKRWARAC